MSWIHCNFSQELAQAEARVPRTQGLGCDGLRPRANSREAVAVQRRQEPCVEGTWDARLRQRNDTVSSARDLGARVEAGRENVLQVRLRLGAGWRAARHTPGK